MHDNKSLSDKNLSNKWKKDENYPGSSSVVFVLFSQKN